ncbi:hypothetical protein [Stratiformator vulcanicus]|uniref:Uncharacterized protein n=1 Tax=Stratiformator vulcanicus TaxID=2527980 RepID=A0A517QXJ8_9PLAN|nr:hypothetical protein [Stratiformator vulcanicus]QDT36313.1 hypothetical protein Pan189_06690 [Stratiformator vulcanicus]
MSTKTGIADRRPLDPIRELRLRRWARENYVTGEERNAGWHPIVLDEMSRRDAEMAKPSRSSFVPLAPGTSHEVHAAHETLAGPKFARSRVRSNETADLPEWSLVESD